MSSGILLNQMGLVDLSGVALPKWIHYLSLDGSDLRG